MSQNDDRSAAILAEAEQLVSEIQKQLDEGEEFCREYGLDREAMSKNLSPKDKAEVARLLAEDMAAVQREVEEGLARLAFSAPSKGTRPAKNRTMI